MRWLGTVMAVWFWTLISSGASSVSEVRVDWYEENPDGLQIGLWAGYVHSPDVLRDFGPRPLERVNFHKWEQFEPEPGVIELEDAFLSEQWAHLAGATVITNVNLFFSHQLNPEGMHAMPRHVVPDLEHPETRAAALHFLDRFVESLLNETGTAWLVLDYEMLWFARPVNADIRRAYRDWFVEAAAAARETAARLGMAEQLKLGVVVNTDPFDTARRLLGNGTWPYHRPESWLLDCAAVADFFAIDTYAGGFRNSVSPKAQLDVIRFWIRHYAGDLPVYITESGFSTSREHGDDRRRYHIRGTEQEQAAFFQEMFRVLEKKNEDPDLRRIRGYCIWKYKDRKSEPDLLERHFGLRHDDSGSTAKPAFQVVAEAIQRIERNSEIAPVRLVSSSPVAHPIDSTNPVPLSRLSGTEYHVLHADLRVPAQSADSYYLEVETSDPVGIIVRLGDSRWLTSHRRESSLHRFQIPDLEPGSGVPVALQVTGFRFPVATDLLKLELLLE